MAAATAQRTLNRFTQFALSVNIAKRRAGGVRIFGDCYFVHEIRLVCEFTAKDGYYEQNNRSSQNYTT